MAKRSVERELEKLRAGEVGWPEFIRRTAPEWLSMARSTARHWVHSEALEEEDVLQEMLAALPKALEDYEPGRGPTFGAFAVWRAHARARRAIHRDRKAPHGDRDRGRSTVAVPLSWMDAPDHEGATFADRLRGEVGDSAEAELECEVLGAARGGRERRVMRAFLAGYSVAEVAARCSVTREEAVALAAACLERAQITRAA